MSPIGFVNAALELRALFDRWSMTDDKRRHQSHWGYTFICRIFRVSHFNSSNSISASQFCRLKFRWIMFEPQEIRSEHKDVIHDVLYDYYGQRIATCSSDQTVKVHNGTLSKTTFEFNKIDCRISFAHRFGIKTKKASGRCRQVGKRIPVQFGVSHGLTPNLVPFWQHVPSIEPSLFGKKRWAKNQRRPWPQWNDGCDAQVSLIHAQVSPIVNLVRNRKVWCWPHAQQMVSFAFMRHPTSWIYRNGHCRTMWRAKHR